jgi:hypothetical protein
MTGRTRQIRQVFTSSVPFAIGCGVLGILDGDSWVHVVTGTGAAGVAYVVLSFVWMWVRPWYRRQLAKLSASYQRQLAKPSKPPQGPWPDESTLGRWRRERSQRREGGGF